MKLNHHPRYHNLVPIKRYKKNEFFTTTFIFKRGMGCVLFVKLEKNIIIITK